MQIVPAQGYVVHVSSLPGECGTAPQLVSNYVHQIYSYHGKKIAIIKTQLHLKINIAFS